MLAGEPKGSGLVDSHCLDLSVERDLIKSSQPRHRQSVTDHIRFLHQVSQESPSAERKFTYTPLPLRQSKRQAGMRT